MLILKISVLLLVMLSGSYTAQNDTILAEGKVFHMCSAEHTRDDCLSSLAHTWPSGAPHRHGAECQCRQPFHGGGYEL